MADFLADLLPIRRILVDGERQAGVRDINFDSEVLSLTVSTDGATLNVSNGTVPTLSFSPLVSLTSSARMVYDGENAGVCAVDVDLSEDFRPGAAVEIFVPADSATGVLLSEIIDPDGSLADLFDSSDDFFIFITATSDATFVASAQSRPTLSLPAAPALTSAVVNSSDLDKLVCTWPVPVFFPDLAGLSLGGTMDVARTITSVVSGNGTPEVTLDLSGDLALTDTPTLVIGSGRTARVFGGGTLVTAETEPVTIVVDDYDYLGLVTLPCLYLYADVGDVEGTSHPTPIADNGAVVTWIDRHGNYEFTEATNRPTYDANGSAGVYPSVNSDGTNDRLKSADTFSTIFGAAPTAFELSWVGRILGVGTLFCAEFGDSFDRFALAVDFSGGNYRVRAFVLDSDSQCIATYVIGATLPTVDCVIQMRLEAGNLYAVYNGTDSAGAACDGVNAAANGQFCKLFQSTSSAASDSINARTKLVAAKRNGSKSSAAIDAWLAKYAI